MTEKNKTPKPQKALLLNTAHDIIKYYKGDIPDWGSKKQKVSFFLRDIRVTKELYLKAIELMENAKHIS